MRAFERLLECIAVLRWVESVSEDALIGEVVRAKLAELDLRDCVDCGKPYFRNPGSRHYRCSRCRWKRHLVISNQVAGEPD